MAMFTDDLEFYDDGDSLNNYAKTKADFVKLYPGFLFILEIGPTQYEE